MVQGWNTTSINASETESQYTSILVKPANYSTVHHCISSNRTERSFTLQSN